MALLCLGFVGCQSVPAPPGYIAAGAGTAAGRIEFPRDLSSEARYALLRWYVEGQGEIVDRWAAPSLAVAQNVMGALARGLRLERYAVLQHKYPIFIDLRESDGTMSFNAKALADRRDWERMEVMLAEIRQVLSESQWMEVPAEEAAAYLEQDRRAEMALSFRQWAAANARIGIPHMPERDAFLKHLETIRAALREKRAVCRLMETAEGQLAKAETAQGGFRLLLQGAAEHAHLAEALAPIGDAATVTLFQKCVAEAPRRWVKVVLEEIHALILSSNLPRDVIETELSQALEQWRQAGILPTDAEAASLCRKAVVEMAKERLENTRALVDERCAAKNYMAAIAVLEGELDRLKSGAPETACYSFFDGGALLVQLQEKSMACFQRHLPDAFHYYQVAQDAALNVDNRFNLALVYDEFATRLAVFVGGPDGTQLPAAVREALGHAHRNASQARQMRARLNRGQRLAVVAEGVPVEEVLRAVRAELHAWGVAEYFQVAAVSGAGENEQLLLTATVAEVEVPPDVAASDSDRGRRRLRAAGIIRMRVFGQEHGVKHTVEHELVGEASASDQPEEERIALRGEALRASFARLQRVMALTVPVQLERQGEALASAGHPLDAAEVLSEARAMAAAFPSQQEEFCARLFRRLSALTSLQPSNTL